MPDDKDRLSPQTAREKFLGLSLESTRKSYYPLLKEQLEAARENENKLQMLIDSLPARISYIDINQRYVFVNREYERTFGLNREQIVGRTICDLIGEKNYRRFEASIARALAGQRVHFETNFMSRSGTEQWLEVSYLPVFNAYGTVVGFYTLIRDLSERKHVEEERLRIEAHLHDAQKFKAIGTLAGGIAHDFNNLLMGIQGRASLMAQEIGANHPLMEHIRAIDEYVLSAANLTKQLLGFARGGKYELKVFDVNNLVLESVEMFGRTAKEISIHKRLSGTPLAIEADRRQLEQVLLNMYLNAWQAMPPEGGAIYLESREEELSATFCSIHDISPGVYAKISITDTGLGMDEATRSRVFDPFFTTKEKQRGTGLGLASAYGIVKNHGGIITVHSEKGHGSTFTIYLPRSEKMVQLKQIVEQKIIKGAGTVLLVDDEALILDVGKAMLETLGYRVFAVNGGEQALELVGREDHIFDLAIVDLIMPGMDGGKVFDRIRERRPDLPVILSSGYSIDGQAAGIMARGCDGFIQKPFTIADLSRIIGEIERTPRGKRIKHGR